MANVRLGNKVYVDSTGAAVESRVMVAYILFTANTALDEMVIKETSDGDPILYLRAATAKNTMMFDFSRKPLVFENGIYIATITSGAKATFVTTQAGS